MIRVKAAFFSFTPPAPPDDDGSYLRWHLLDHMPEQYQLPGILHACAGSLTASTPTTGWHRSVLSRISAASSTTSSVILSSRPTTTSWSSVRRLAGVGRFPQRRASLGLYLLALQRWYAAPRALISAEVVPFRPHRGVIVVVEEPAGGDTSGWLQWLHREHLPAATGGSGRRWRLAVWLDERLEAASPTFRASPST